MIEAYAAGLNHYAARNPHEVKLANLFPVNGTDIAAGFNAVGIDSKDRVAIVLPNGPEMAAVMPLLQVVKARG